MKLKGQSSSSARGSAAHLFGVGAIFALAVLGVASACSQRFQSEIDREINRIYQPAVADVCRADADRLCSQETRGGGRVATCLAAHESELSSACKQVVTGREDIRTACNAELVNLCKEPAARPQLKVRCLDRRRDKLSTQCREALDDYQSEL